MTRMNQLALCSYLISESYFSLAMDFSDVPDEDVTDGEIDANLVRAMVEEIDPSGLLLRKIQSEVTSHIYLKSPRLLTTI